MDIKELYNKRKAAFSEARRIHKENLDSFSKEKKKMIADAIALATVEAEKSFTEKHGYNEEIARKLLEEAEAELILLQCPDVRLHCRPYGGYYSCLCGYVWDDKSPAHP